MMSQSYKRPLAFLLALLLGLGVTNSAFAEKKNIPQIMVDANGQSVIDVGELFWIDEEGIVFAEGTDSDFSLYRWQTGGKEESLRLPLLNDMLDESEKKYPDASFAYLPMNRGVCAFSWRPQLMYIYHDAKWSEITDSIRPYNILSMYQAILDGDILYLHVKLKLLGGKSAKKVIRYDMSKSVSSLIPIENIEGLSTYKDGMLLVRVNGNIRAYDPVNNHMGDVLYHPSTPSVDEYAPFVYDLSRDKLICMIDGDLYQVGADGQANCIRILDSIAFETSTPNHYHYENMIRGLYLLHNGMVGLLKQGILTVFWPEIVTHSVETLHVTRSIYPLANAFYQMENPNLRIEYCLPIGIYTTITDLQETGHPVDVFTSSSDENLLDLIEDGKMHSLHSSALIDQLLASYLPSISEKICCESLPMVLPFVLYVHLWEVNDEKWAYYKMPPPPATFDELQCQMREWDAAGLGQGTLPAYFGNGGLGNAKVSLAMLLTIQYIENQMQANGAVDFTSHEYRDLIKAIIDLPNIPTSETGTMLRGMIFRGLISSPIDSLNTHAIPTDEYTSDDRYSYVLPLSLYPNESVPLMGDLSALCLSKDSKNITRAMDYLEFIAQYQIDYESDTIASFQGKLRYGCSELDLLYSQIVSNLKIERSFIDYLQCENLDAIFESFLNVDLSETMPGTSVRQDPLSADELDSLLNLLSACFAE